MEGFGDFAGAQQLHNALSIWNQASRNQMRTIHSGARFEMIGNPPDIHRQKPSTKPCVAESALRHLPKKGHLTTFKAQANRTA
jgi:hypothetical protein